MSPDAVLPLAPCLVPAQVAVASPDGQLIYAGSRGALVVLRRSDLVLLDACKVCWC